MSVWVYIAGPYSSGNIENTTKAIKMGTFLRQQGFTPIIPHLTAFWDLVDPSPYEEWLAYDLQVLQRCDVLLRLPGESSGADGEVEAAKVYGIPVFEDEGILLMTYADRL